VNPSRRAASPRAGVLGSEHAGEHDAAARARPDVEAPPIAPIDCHDRQLQQQYFREFFWYHRIAT
jgi:hypothetical protein